MKRVLTSAVLLSTLATGAAWGQEPDEPPLRLDESVAAVAADLKRFITERMAADGVPGVSVALVRDWQVAWADGFGVANAVTRAPIEVDGVFEAASNSKLVTAFLALQLVDAGVLELDAHVSGQLAEPWLIPGADADRITLRHLASHSSGLVDQLFPLDKTVHFAPGTQYRYSGVGFLYLQEVLEQASGQPLEQLGRARLFGPLGLTLTDYVGTATTRRNAVNGHMGLRNALMVALIPSSVSFGLLLLAASVYRRGSRGSWRVGGRLALVVLAASLVVTTVAVSIVIGRALPNVVLLAVVCCAVFYGLVSASAVLSGRVTKRPGVRFACVALTVVLLWWLTGPLSVPVPSLLSPQASAVGSVRTSAVDLATFLIELGRPQHLGADLAAELRSPQTPINDTFSWGLGPAIQHSEHGDALWQMGITPGFRSVMLIYPDHGLGVVVMANSSDALPLVYAVAARAVGGRDDFSAF